MNGLETIPAKSLFDDFTYLGHDREDKTRIEKICFAQGYIAIVDYDADMGWVFHTLQHPTTDTVSRKPIAKKFKSESIKKGNFYSEKEMEIAFSEALNLAGIPHKRQVWCPVGCIDVVTITSIVEIKLTLSRGSLFGAIGQVLAYQAAYDATREPIILTKRIEPEATGIVDICDHLGVRVVIWDGVNPDIAMSI